MKMNISLLLLPCMIAGCSPVEFSEHRSLELESVDKIFRQVEQNATANEIQSLCSVDHSRLAEEVDAVLDANKVGFCLNPEINSRILKENIRAGLDLPYRIQACYDEGVLHVAYTSTDFIRIRHGLRNSESLHDLAHDISSLSAGIPKVQPIGHTDLAKDYGIIELESDYGFDQSIERLKKWILAEGDTIWLQDIDCQQQAEEFGTDLPRSRLLVFGAPYPGAKAMRTFPTIGLDAFPQKVLVYEQNANVYVIYNDIPALANLDYKDSDLSHRVIAKRLKKTLAKAISMDE